MKRRRKRAREKVVKAHNVDQDQPNSTAATAGAAGTADAAGTAATATTAATAAESDAADKESEAEVVTGSDELAPMQV